MAYTPSSNFPPQSQTQYQQSLQNNYQSDHYPQQDFTQQGQDTVSQQNLFSQTPFTQQPNAYPQDSFPQQLQSLSDPPNSYTQQSTPYSQPGQFPQQRISQTHQGQNPRQQTQQPHTQFTQQQPLQPPYLSPSQQPQQPFTQVPRDQYPQATSAADQNSYTQQNPYSQAPQAPADRFDQTVQPSLYNLNNQTTLPNLNSQPTSLPQSNHLFNTGAQIQANGFPQQTQRQQQGQRHFSPIQPPQLNPHPLQTNFNGQPGQSQGGPFPQLSDQPVQRSQSLPYTPQQQRQSGDVAGTYQLFFTGRDDPRCCMLIGEDTKPVYLTFDTQESNLNQTIRTMVYKNTRDLCAKLEWGTGGFLGTATIGDRRFPMAQLIVPGSMDKARRFVSIDGKQFEWRRIRNDTMAYDLYMAPNVRIALFRKYNQLTPIGPSHGLIQYTFSNDVLLIEALLALLLNRWIDTNGIQFTG